MLHVIDPNIKTTILAHFYNEEWLLPHWLNHHLKLFNHGILINYASTDNSIDIIKKITPTWEIHNSKNKMFDATACDEEMMSYERNVSGWKMILNITEFLFTNNLKEKIKKLEQKNISMVRSIGYQINDIEKENPFDDNQPLILQRFHGRLDPKRGRILHNCKDGNYILGRHNSKYKDILISDDFYTFWYNFAFMKQQIPRKIQISSRIPESDIKKGFGVQHWDLTEEKLFSLYFLNILNKCDHDVRFEPGIQKEYLKICNMYKNCI